MSSLILLISAMLLSGESGNDLPQKLKSMDNSSIQWHTTYVGVLPMIDADLLKACRANQKEKWFRSQLLSKLEDEDSFAVAHVVLVYSIEGKWDGKAHSGWFGLEFELKDNGEVVFDAEKDQMERLTKIWKTRLEAPDKKK